MKAKPNALKIVGVSNRNITLEIKLYVKSFFINSDLVFDLTNMSKAIKAIKIMLPNGTNGGLNGKTQKLLKAFTFYGFKVFLTFAMRIQNRQTQA